MALHMKSAILVVLLSGTMLGAAEEKRSAVSACRALAKLQIDNAKITSSEMVAAATPLEMRGFPAPIVFKSLPAHCRVEGIINQHQGKDGKQYGDRFELRMPSDWKGRLLFQGGGGLDGILNPAVGIEISSTGEPGSALSRGYAVVATDAGHQQAMAFGADGSFAADPDARADYNYRSTTMVMNVVRKIIPAFYGEPAKYSYFKGCSNGGREAMLAVQRYPDCFDGVIAGSPGFNLTNAATAEAWYNIQLAKIAPKNDHGEPDLAKTFSDGDLRLLADAVLKQCDELDGLKDGLVADTEACKFDPAVLQCKGQKAESCLSDAQVGALHAVFAGPKDSKGKSLYSDWPYDAGIADTGWRIWILGTAQIPALNTLMYPDFFNGPVLAGQPPKVEAFKFDFDRDTTRSSEGAAEINAVSTDLSEFKKHSGKLIMYAGMSDSAFSANDLIAYYKRVIGSNGGPSSVEDFARLFLVPGMGHCAVGPALDTFDTLTAIENWVERGRAPQSLIATGKRFPGRSRPLCPFPRFAKYNGSGNPENASSFSCQAPVSTGSSNGN